MSSMTFLPATVCESARRTRTSCRVLASLLLWLIVNVANLANDWMYGLVVSAELIPPGVATCLLMELSSDWSLAATSGARGKHLESTKRLGTNERSDPA